MLRPVLNFSVPQHFVSSRSEQSLIKSRELAAGTGGEDLENLVLRDVHQYEEGEVILFLHTALTAFELLQPSCLMHGIQVKRDKPCAMPGNIYGRCPFMAPYPALSDAGP